MPPQLSEPDDLGEQSPLPSPPSEPAPGRRGFLAITVGGKDYEIGPRWFAREHHDPAERLRVAQALAEAEHELIMADAYYRNWVARYTSTVLKTNPKVPLNRVHAALEQTSTFIEYRKSIAVATHNALLLRIANGLEISS